VSETAKFQFYTIYIHVFLVILLKFCCKVIIMTTKHWVPLESNPDILSEYASKLGAENIDSEYAFCDVYGLDEVGTIWT
jgi:hypothetical protein